MVPESPRCTVDMLTLFACNKSPDIYIHSGLMFWNYISIIEKIESLPDPNIDRHQQELAIYIQHQ
jgi:hypothetical protein